VFLAEGEPEGLWVVTKQNWTGVALRFSRNTYKDVRGRDELGRPGVYVLVGDSAAADDRRKIYVGEGGVIRDRINTHLSQLDFWTEAVVFVAADDFNVSHAKYLEAKLLDLARGTKRSVVTNAQPMTGPTLGEAETADMETFLAEMLVIYPILGISAFESPAEVAGERLVLKGKDTKASGQRTAEGFLVFAGATARKTPVASAGRYPRALALRDELLAGDGLVEQDGRLVLAQDYVFSAPSLAAAVLLGRNANGRVEWKTRDGKTLKELEEHEAGALSFDDGQSTSLPVQS